MKIATNAAVCDSTVRYQEKLISRDLKAFVSTDSLLSIRTERMKAAQAEAATNYALYMTQIRITAVMEKQKRKWVVIAGVAILVVIVETTLVILALAK